MSPSRRRRASARRAVRAHGGRNGLAVRAPGRGEQGVSGRRGAAARAAEVSRHASGVAAAPMPAAGRAVAALGGGAVQPRRGLRPPGAPARAVACACAAAHSPASQPASTSPVPALASRALPLPLITRRFVRGAAITLPEPLSSTTQPKRAASCSALAEAIGLDRARASSSPTSRAASSGCGVSTVAWPRASARASRVCKAAVGGNGVQCIGIEHQPRRACQQAWQDFAHRIATAAAADHRGGRECARRLAPQPGRNISSGHKRVEAGRSGVEHADIDAAGAGGQRGAASQQGRTGHAAGAADDDHVAEAALVLGVASRRPQLPCGFDAAEQGARRDLSGAVAATEVVEPDIAGRSRPCAVNRPGLSVSSASVWRGLDGSGAEHRTGVGVEPARQVDRQARGRGGH